MIVDTGASGTVITQPMAAALSGRAKAKAILPVLRSNSDWLSPLEVGGAFVKMYR